LPKEEEKILSKEHPIKEIYGMEKLQTMLFETAEILTESFRKNNV